MKIKITEIEANAEDLRAGQTLGTAFSNVLRSAFLNIGAYGQPDESPVYDDEDQSEGE